MDDEKIIALYFERNEDAIRHTKIKYGNLCYKIANNILNSYCDSEECVNDTYLGIWNAIPPTRPTVLRNFICRIARNIAITRFQHMNAKKRSKDMEISLSELEDVLPDRNISVDATDEELGEIISEFLRHINEVERNIFIKKYWFFEPIKDIALLYGFSESKVKQVLYRTRNELKQYLIEQGVYL